MIGIGDYDKISRRGVRTRPGQVMYMGKKYMVEDKTGYYVCTSGDRKRLHVAIWEHEHGVKVPPGCVIHHIDWVKKNNSFGNLICLTQEEHNLIHNGKKTGGIVETVFSPRVVKLTQEFKANRDERGLPPGLDK